MISKKELNNEEMLVKLSTEDEYLNHYYDEDEFDSSEDDDLDEDLDGDEDEGGDLGDDDLDGDE